MPIIFVVMSCPQPSGEFEDASRGVPRCAAAPRASRVIVSARANLRSRVFPLCLPERALLARALGVEPASSACTRCIAPTCSRHRGESDSRAEADIAITDDPSIAISVRGPTACHPPPTGEAARLRLFMPAGGARRGRGYGGRRLVTSAIRNERRRRHRRCRSEHRPVPAEVSSTLAATSSEGRAVLAC
jgi:hypothetical protein